LRKLHARQISSLAESPKRVLGPNDDGALADGRCGIAFFLQLVCFQLLPIISGLNDTDHAAFVHGVDLVVGCNGRGKIAPSSAIQSFLLVYPPVLWIHDAENAPVPEKVKQALVEQR
jgi:hypothetical protein